MKKAMFIFAISLVIVSCSSSEEPDEITKNPFKGTSWTADDPIASIIYGEGCTTTIEFLTDTECQEINYIPNGIFKGTNVEFGVYKFNGDVVTWKIDDTYTSATLSGSILISTIVIHGNPITYKKN